MFNHVLEHVLSCFPALASKAACRRSKLSDADRLLLTLMRLRHGLRVQDIAYRFQIGLTTASNIFSDWLDAMYLSLKVFIMWPTQDLCFQNMPQIFKDIYPRTRCIIDCSQKFLYRTTILIPTTCTSIFKL